MTGKRKIGKWPNEKIKTKMGKKKTRNVKDEEYERREVKT